MIKALPLLLTSLCIAARVAAAGEWRAAERIEPYAVSGNTGIELYRSIGERGPKAGIGRAIATTTFDLKWSRKYVPSSVGCTLQSARPHLVIITRLPKTARKLPAATQVLWDGFIAGIVAHEKVHGDFIIDMVRKIEAASVGLTVPEDPGCRKVRQELQLRLKQLSDEQRARSREFDRIELSEGGTVHRLVLALVNG